MFSAGGEQIVPFMTYEDIFQLVQHTKHAEKNEISRKVAVEGYLRYRLGAPDHASPCYTEFIESYDALLNELHDRETQIKYKTKIC